jgi:hypothetical protein
LLPRWAAARRHSVLPFAERDAAITNICRNERQSTAALFDLDPRALDGRCSLAEAFAPNSIVA